MLRAGSASILVCAMAALAPRAAHAWNFPEHMELTRFAFERELPREAQEQIEAAVKVAATEYKGLCTAKSGSRIEELVQPLERVADTGGRCLPYSALPALAGDHANGWEDLGKLAGEKGAGLEFLRVVADEWLAYLDSSAPPEVKRLFRSTAWLCTTTGPGPTTNGAPRVFLRTLDIALEAVDPEYRSRAKSSRAHFQDTMTPVDVLLRQLEARGNVDNALGQMLAHHIRSLQLARMGREKWAKALFEHANALHYMQDAFASGHIGTEHSLGVDEDKLRRHDFLSRAGLNVQRLALPGRCEMAQPTVTDDDPDRRCPTVAPQCWIAYGDSYLDQFNARVVAEAVARVQMQFAIALSLGDSEHPGFAEAWVAQCRVDDAVPAPAALVKRWTGHLTEKYVEGEQETRDELTFEQKPVGQGVAQVCSLSREPTAKRLRITAASADFDPYVVVRDAEGKKLAGARSVSLLDTGASVTLDADPGALRVEVGSENGEVGQYTVTIHALNDEATARAPAGPADCTSMRASARLLDPLPSWSRSPREQQRRATWGERDDQRIAHYLVGGVLQALRRPEFATASIPAEAGSKSGAIRGVVPAGLLGSPLRHCFQTAAWTGLQHPLCDAPGFVFRSGDPDASLFRPLLAAWPTAMGDITVIEGKDAFGTGLAAQVVYGGGPTVGFATDVPLLFSAWFGTGISYRLNNLFPTRENRSLVEANVTVQPTLSSRDQYRYMMAGFFEGRVPLITGALYWLFPSLLSDWVSMPFEIGPQGYRLYFQWPNLIPGGEGDWIVGHDLEILNIDLDRSSGPRAKDAGHVMDKELRVRLGRFERRYLVGTGEDWDWALMVEFAWGHSTYFNDL